MQNELTASQTTIFKTLVNNNFFTFGKIYKRVTENAWFIQMIIQKNRSKTNLTPSDT